MKARWLFVFVSSLFFLGNGCSTATTRKIQGTYLTPAAEGTVKIDKAANNNNSIDLKVKHLAPANRIEPNATSYIVWLQPTVGDTQAVQNMGALKVDENLNGEFKTITPHRNFNLFITAESSPMVSRPSGQKILEVPLTRSAE
jgi:hypothetical protein